MKNLYIIIFAILIQLSPAGEKVVNSNLIMGRGKIFTYLINEQNLTMETCYDDGINQIAMFTNEDTNWLYVDNLLELKSLSVLLGGKKSDIKFQFKDIKYKHGNSKIATCNIGATFKLKQDLDVSITMTFLSGDDILKVIFLREPFDHWVMKITKTPRIEKKAKKKAKGSVTRLE